MKVWSIFVLVLSLGACSAAEEPAAEETGCSDTNPCPVGQACETGSCVDVTGAVDETDPTDTPDPNAPTTDATWPASSEAYATSHLSLMTRLELSPEAEGNKFGELLRFLAGQADISVEGYFDEYITTGQLVSLVDHQGVTVTSEAQAFLMTHFHGTWDEGTDWDAISSGTGAVTVDPENFDANSGTPLGAYDSATLSDGTLTGTNGYMNLTLPEDNILSSIKMHESQLLASDVALSADGMSYAGDLSGWISVAEWYESLNRAFESMCACAGFTQGQDLWSQTEPGVYDCEPDQFDTGACVGDENEELCTQGLPLCGTLTFVIRGDLDKDPEIPGDDAMSILLEIETQPVAFTGLTPAASEEEPEDDGADCTQ